MFILAQQKLMKVHVDLRKVIKVTYNQEIT